MTPAERRALVMKPFPIVTRHTTCYPWAGRLIGEETVDEKLKRLGKLPTQDIELMSFEMVDEYLTLVEEVIL